MRWMILSAALAMAPSASQAATVYKWVDAQGTTHFDAQPPAGQQVQRIDVQRPAPPSTADTPAGDDIEGAAQQRNIDARVKEQIREQETRRSENCEALRTNLSQLRNNPRVREATEDGSRRLTEAERKSRIEETEKAISDNCR
ncbi:DUF4124 domain-containing protein [Pseudomonas sp. JDS28PS106]|uniref:DUF4124 domain-containing protein n=1 Tax=Pseudomonas sp. JDS28PS106 TaxID=2497235 RepID=UPI002FCFD1F5